MLRRIMVVIEGDTNILPGTEVSIDEFKRENKEVLKNRGRLAVGRPIYLGITRASLRSVLLICCILPRNYKNLNRCCN